MNSCDEISSQSPSVQSFLKWFYKKFKLQKFLRGDDTFHAMYAPQKLFLNFECEMNCGNFIVIPFLKCVWTTWKKTSRILLYLMSILFIFLKKSFHFLLKFSIFIQNFHLQFFHFLIIYFSTLFHANISFYKLSKWWWWWCHTESHIEWKKNIFKTRFPSRCCEAFTKFYS